VRIILFTGKGGVGKTTLAAATALRSASLGYRTLVISTDIAHSLADVLDLPLNNEPRQVGPPNLWATELDSGQELERYWGEVKRRIAAVLRDEGLEATVAGELAILPGLDEILALVRIKSYHDGDDYDALIIDSAPTGAAMRLLSAPDLSRWYTRSLLKLSPGLVRAILPSLRRAIRAPIGQDAIQRRIRELFDQIEALRAVLADGALTSVRLVLNPERMAIRETQRAYTYMNLFGFSVDALYVNRILPEEIQDPYLAQWMTSQAAHRREIRELFDPLPVFGVPLMRSEVVGLQKLRELSDGLYGHQDPIPPLAVEQPLRFYVEDGRYMLALRVVGVSGGAIDLEKEGDELRVRLGRFRRSLALPQYLAGLQPAWAQVEDGHLKIAFEEPLASEEREAGSPLL